MNAARARWDKWAMSLLLAAGAGAAIPAASRKPRVVGPRVVPVAGKPLVTVEWSPDGKRLACFSQDNSLYILDAASGKRLQRRRFKRPVDSVRWRPDWKRLAVRGQDGRIQVWDVSSWKVVRTVRRKMPLGWGGNVEGMEWSPDGALLAVAEAGDDPSDGYDLRTGKSPKLFSSERNIVRILEVTTGRQKLLLRHRRIVGPIMGHDYFRFDLAWRPDGRRLATCLHSNRTWSSPLQVWDAATGRRVRELGGRPEGAPEAPSWRPDGKRLAAAWAGVTVWDPATGRSVRTLGDEEWQRTSDYWNPEALAWSPDGTHLAVRTYNDYYGYASDNVAPLRVWQVGTGKLVCVLRQKGAFIKGPAWSPDGKRLACAASDGTVRIWYLPFVSQGR